MSAVTRPLEAAAGGDRKAAADLLPLVYDELRRLATAKLAAEAPGHSLNPTALVHEAYLRLVGDQRFDGRGHFFAVAAEVMQWGAFGTPQGSASTMEYWLRPLAWPAPFPLALLPEGDFRPRAGLRW
jgi:hypothetical protein